MAEVEEEQEAAAVVEEEEEIQDLTPLPEMTGGAAVGEVLSTVTVEQGHQEEVVEEVEEVVALQEKVGMLTTALLVTEGSGWRL